MTEEEIKGEAISLVFFSDDGETITINSED